jgi:hypothetical protein
MWIALNNSFLSIVAHTERSDKLLIRARMPGDIERVFPDADVFTLEHADYKYRAVIDRGDVGNVIADLIEDIDYPDFKSSVADQDRHDAYLKIWSVMRGMQH